MVAGDPFDAESLRKAEAKLFIDMVKRHRGVSTSYPYPHCGGSTSYTYDEFKSLLKKANNLNSDDQKGIDRLLTDVRSFFSYRIYLIHGFKRFLPNPYPRITSTSKPVVPKTPSYHQKQCLQEKQSLFLKRKTEILDFINRVKSAVDHSVFRELLQRIMAYQKYSKDSVRRVKKRKLVNLLKDNPDLKAQLYAMLCDEDDMQLADLSFNRMISARDAAEKLISENQSAIGRMEDEIDVTDYFSQVDFKCIRDVLEGSTILADTHMSRGMAVEDSMEISSWLTNKIREAREMRWTDEEMDVLFDEQEEIEIPEWDWHQQLSEDKFQHFPPLSFGRESRPIIKRGKTTHLRGQTTV